MQASISHSITFSNLKILTLNANGLADKNKHMQLFQFLRQNEIDIACIQEVHSTKARRRIFKSEWGAQAYFSDGTSNSKGVAIFVSNRINMENVKIDRDNEGRSIQINFAINNCTYRVINVYAPNEDLPDFFVNILEGLQHYTEDHILLMGDFNKYLDPKKDKKGVGTLILAKSAQVINAFIEDSDWVDIWRTLYEDKFQYTWSRRKPLIMHRLDYVLAPIGTCNIIKSCEIEHGTFSDHATVIVDLYANIAIRGPGLWKLNNRHLQNVQYVAEMNETLDLVNLRYDDLSPMNRWEMIQHDMAQTSNSFARRFAQEHKIKIKEWQKKLNTAKKKLAMINLSSEKAVKLIEKVNIKIDDLTLKLKKEGMYDAQGAIFACKGKMGGSSGNEYKIFYGLEKRNSKAKTMVAVYDEKEKLVNESSKVLRVQSKFYKKLYMAQEHTRCDINIQPERKLTQQQKELLDSEVTEDEITQAIKSLARGKSPGTSGFSVDIYIVFWLRLKEHFISFVQHMLKHRMLSQTARRGIITLIPKSGHNLKHVKNWRPIVLFNTEYKVISKIFAQRLKTVLPDLISTDQTGFVAGRNISDNLRKILDAVEYTNQHKNDALILLIDFKTAFDRVEYASVSKIMEWMNLEISSQRM